MIPADTELANGAMNMGCTCGLLLCAIIVWSTTQEIFVLNVDLIISVTQQVGKPVPARDPRGGRFHRGGGLDAAAPLSVWCLPVPQACSLLLGGTPRLPGGGCISLDPLRLLGKVLLKNVLASSQLTLKGGLWGSRGHWLQMTLSQ